MIYFLILLALLQVADAWTTSVILAHGGRELNPVIKWLIPKITMWGAKAVWGLFTVAVAYSGGRTLTVILTALYVALIIWNLIQVRIALKQ